MANTYTALATVTAGSGGSNSFEFTNIPNTYTDLCILASVRSDQAGDISNDSRITFNGSTSNYTQKRLEGTGSAASSDNSSSRVAFVTNSAAATSNTFANVMIYIPNYAGSNYKSWSSDSVSENNATTASTYLMAGLWSDTSAITSIDIAVNVASKKWVQYSTATLYGIKNS
jgi:hypothetical protein